MMDSDILDLVTRLQQIEQESDLLASQQQELQRQLQSAELARDERRTGPGRQSGVRFAESHCALNPVEETPPIQNDVADVADLVKIRHFLDSSSGILPEEAPPGSQLLVVIDHREARIFQTELPGSLLECIARFDPHGFGRHLHHVQNDSHGRQMPERKSNYAAVAKTLHGAVQILMIGIGAGGSSAMDQLLAELNYYEPEVALRIVGSMALDEQYLTENQLLARARDFYHSALSASVK